MPRFSLALDMIRGNEPRRLPHQASVDTNQCCSLVDRVQGAAVVGSEPSLGGMFVFWGHQNTTD